jgi:dimeric dUTPase (all-alpha-NTP-PPase superfamily)
MSVTEKELRVYADEKAEASRNFMEYSLEKMDFLKDILESYEDGIFLVSRELTRRTKDLEDMNRTAKFNA